jgi:D-sedoheptulose 7-phosphate isomerase
MPSSDAEILLNALDAHRRMFESLADTKPGFEAAATLCRDAMRSGRRIFFCGNGGSAADAQHAAAELTGRFKRERKGIAAVALTTDSSALTAIANDYGFDAVFARQLQALGAPGDALIAISTSGDSPNVLQAAKQARSLSMKVVALTGKGGGRLADLADVTISVSHEDTARIQEAHIFMLHCLCDSLEQAALS